MIANSAMSSIEKRRMASDAATVSWSVTAPKTGRAEFTDCTSSLTSRVITAGCSCPRTKIAMCFALR